jgi:hypothetical protein
MNNDHSTATTGDDSVQLDFDWHRQRDLKVLFDVWIQRWGQRQHIEFLVDYPVLDNSQRERLESFLGRLPVSQTSLVERIQTVAWALDISLEQQRPMMTPVERANEVNRLLLVTPRTDETTPQAREPITARRALFETIGWDFVIQAGPDHLAFFEAAKKLPFYQEIGESWVRALETIDFGIPKLALGTPCEAFFIELRHGGDLVAIQNKYSSAIQPHLNDQKWRDAIADTIKSALHPDNSQPILDFYQIKGWLHAGLWGLDHKHRALILQEVYGLQDTENKIRKHVRELKLLAWADYRSVYQDPSNGHAMAPFGCTVFEDQEGDKIFTMRIREPFQKWA